MDGALPILGNGAEVTVCIIEFPVIPIRGGHTQNGGDREGGYSICVYLIPPRQCNLSKYDNVEHVQALKATRIHGAILLTDFARNDGEHGCVQIDNVRAWTVISQDMQARLAYAETIFGVLLQSLLASTFTRAVTASQQPVNFNVNVVLSVCL